MLDRIRPLAGSTYDPATGRTVEHYRSSSCLFVTVPDVVGDAEATAHRFECWESAVRGRGLPPAIVLQDGVEHLDRWLFTAFLRCNAVFIGGSTEWKLGPYAAAYARSARRRGLWVHWGRVNTERRIDHVLATGACDSFDGTGWAKWRHTHLDRGLAYLAGRAAYERDQLRLPV